MVETASVPYGIKYVVEGEIQAPDGSGIWLRSVWIVLDADDVPRFVTAYPVPRPGP